MKLFVSHSKELADFLSFFIRASLPCWNLIWKLLGISPGFITSSYCTNVQKLNPAGDWELAFTDVWEDLLKISEILNKFEARWSPNSKAWVNPAERHGQREQSLCPARRTIWSFSKPTRKLAVSSACSKQFLHHTTSLFLGHPWHLVKTAQHWYWAPCLGCCIGDFPLYMQESVHLHRARTMQHLPQRGVNQVWLRLASQSNSVGTQGCPLFGGSPHLGIPCGHQNLWPC